MGKIGKRRKRSYTGNHANTRFGRKAEYQLFDIDGNLIPNDGNVINLTERNEFFTSKASAARARLKKVSDEYLMRHDAGDTEAMEEISQRLSADLDITPQMFRDHILALQKKQNNREDDRHNADDSGTLYDKTLRAFESKTRRLTDVYEGDIEAARHLMRSSPRYVIDKKAWNLLCEVADQNKSFAEVKAPVGTFWMEGPPSEDLKTVTGVHYIGSYHPEIENISDIDVNDLMEKADLSSGELLIHYGSPGGKLLSQTVHVVIGEKWTLAGRAKTAYDEASAEDRQKMLAILGQTVKMFQAFCMLITSPKTHIVEEVEFSRLNKQRVKKGKKPLNSYSRVRLSIDGPVMRHGHASSSGDTSEATGDPIGKRLHLVSCFWRTRLGKLEFVRPHWRGNAELGTVTPKRKVTA